MMDFIFFLISLLIAGICLPFSSFSKLKIKTCSYTFRSLLIRVIIGILILAITSNWKFDNWRRSIQSKKIFLFLFFFYFFFLFFIFYFFFIFFLFFIFIFYFYFLFFIFYFLFFNWIWILSFNLINL
jgi:hypothetical protein